MKNVYVAMSGGVDSSVAAALLKKEGHNLVGVFMKPWQPEKGGICLWKEDREDAMRVASKLGIKFKTWDFSREYKKSVTDYMIREYKAGRTPNPDVMCNKEIKFGLFFDRAIKEGADFIATGHYVRRGPVSHHPIGAQTKRLRAYGVPTRATPVSLLMAKDKNKDQSYFLWTLNQRILSKCLFPIGDYFKPEVRKLAKKFGLPTHDKKDSQGVCFIGPLNMKEFLKFYIKPKRGKIIDSKGNIIGEHDGVFYYTIGQRHGLDIKNGQGPYYIVSKNIKKNIIYVGEEKNLGETEAEVKDISWVREKIKLPIKIGVRTRYRAPIGQATLYKNGRLNFKNKERALTPGQSAVFYRGEELLGGGIIS